MTQDIHVFLPCRQGSERVPRKNIRDFAGVKGGLLKIKIDQLLQVEEISSIILSTNDDEILEYVRANYANTEKLKPIKRDNTLCRSGTSTDEVIAYVPSIIQSGHVLWTHVTSPFISTQTYQRAIAQYFKNMKAKAHDSLMSVNPIQTFIWDSQKSLNYDRTQEKWPRTQTLPKWYEVNSGIFMIARDLMDETKDRIGRSPYLFETDYLESFDIDTQKQFDAGEMLYKSLKA